MRQKDKESLDADVMIACNQCRGNDTIMYFRNDGEYVSISWTGCVEELVSGFVTCIENYPEMYEVLDAALVLYEEAHPEIIENQNEEIE